MLTIHGGKLRFSAVKKGTSKSSKIKRLRITLTRHINEHTLFIVMLCLFVRLITSRCQLQGSGTAGSETAPATRRDAWEQRGASWPCMPLGFRSLRHIRDTLTDSLVMCSSPYTHTHNETCKLTHTTHQAHMLMHYFYTIAHACIKASTHDCPYVRIGMTELTIQTKWGNKVPNRHLFSCETTRSLFRFFLCNFDAVRDASSLSSAMLFESVTCSHYTDIIHKAGLQ